MADWRALWDDLHHRGRRHALRDFLCEMGLHWPIVFSDVAYPGSYEPPEPPEPGWCCGRCGELHEPYSWPLRAATIWRLKSWWYERRQPHDEGMF